jgi:hypothetical protein
MKVEHDQSMTSSTSTGKLVRCTDFTGKMGRQLYMQVPTTEAATTGVAGHRPKLTNGRYADAASGKNTFDSKDSYCEETKCMKSSKQPCDKASANDFVSNDEVKDWLGKAWRQVLLHLVVVSFDEVNALRFTRQLQLFLPFLTGHEAFALSLVIQAMDGGSRKEVRAALGRAFTNRNVSRILVQTLRIRYDFLWHWSTMITWNRLFDAWGLIPVIGITGFPGTENFPSTRNHALASMFRLLLGPGNWPTRVITRGREALVTDNHEITAQNLAAESNGLELALRNQYGTYFGRQKLLEFRLAHRLPTDEWVERTFVSQPMSTMVNNGVVHVLRVLSKHWHNMLSEPCGNFSHQRMEQIDPFETLRFHIPEVLLVLASLRGRSAWDATVMGSIIKRLQALKPSSTADEARQLARELHTNIIGPVCGGIPSVINPFRSWVDAIAVACDRIEQDASEVHRLVSAEEQGINLGYELFTKVKWNVPSDSHLQKLILDHIDGKFLATNMQLRIRSALELTTPRDKRTLIELVKKKLAETKPAKLLLGRVKTLLQRELRRDLLNKTIQHMSRGKKTTTLVDGDWYWVESKQRGREGVNIFDKKGSTSDFFLFIHAYSGRELLISRMDSSIKLRRYVPVGEAIR